ncbi:MAG: TauD/TfdA family dioxygenase [Deltaproteobacteria bacterium]
MGSLRDELRARGFVHVARHVSADEFEALCTSLGTISARSEVALRKGARSYLASPEAVPFHTDFVVDVIAWRCEVQDPIAGASLLLDARAVLATLSAVVETLLRNTRIEMRAAPGSAPHRREVLQGVGCTERLSFAPWLEPVGVGPRESAAYDDLRRAVTAAAQQARAVRLMPGEALLLDNGRFLHGRGPLPVDSRRRLSRRWIESP